MSVDITPFQSEPPKILVIDVTAGVTFNTGTNDLATAWAAAKAGTPGNTVPDSGNPGILRLPEGVFDLGDTPLELDHDYLHLEGAGANATIIKGAVSSSSLIDRSKICNIGNLQIQEEEGDCINDSAAGAANSRSYNLILKSGNAGTGACLRNPRSFYRNIEMLRGDVAIDGLVSTARLFGCFISGPTVSLAAMAGGLFRDCTIIGGASGICAVTPSGVVTFHGCELTASDKDLFDTADYLRFIGCNVDGVASKAILGAIAGDNIEIIGGRFAAGSGGSIFEIPNATTRRVSISGQPRLVGTLKGGAGTFSPAGGGFTILPDGTAATYDGVLVYDETADTHKGQQNNVAKTFTVS